MPLQNTTFRPISDGLPLDWTPSAAGTHYTLVDDPFADEDLTYVYCNGGGQSDVYGINTFTTTCGFQRITINSLTFTVRARKTALFDNMSIWGGDSNKIPVNVDFQILTTAYANYTFTVTTNPVGGLPYTQFDVDELNMKLVGVCPFGIPVGDIRVTMFYFVINWRYVQDAGYKRLCWTP
jgi:hypothetical protein